MSADLSDLPAAFTLAEAITAGAPRHAVYAWRDAGRVIQVSRGVYRKADAAETAHLDVLVAARRAPRAVVCLVSALALHDLPDEIPPAVQLAVPRGLNPPQIRAAVIREDALYSGLRITMPATLGKARIKLAPDVDFGDPITPGAVRIPCPSVLESQTFEILAYPIETVLAEKITTAVNLGEINTRERDWADIWRLTGGHDLDGGTLSEALRRTARYRGISLVPLSQRLGSLVDSRSGNYRTWRHR